MFDIAGIDGVGEEPALTMPWRRVDRRVPFHSAMFRDLVFQRRRVSSVTTSVREAALHEQPEDPTDSACFGLVNNQPPPPAGSTS